MFSLTHRRGCIYAGPAPLSLTDGNGDTVTPTGPGPDLVAALAAFTFDPPLAEGEEITLDGHTVARVTGGQVVAA